MAGLFPFRALRPTPAAAKAVAAVPYDVVSTPEAAALADGNPLSFLHVSRAEIDLPTETDPYDEAVYETAANNLRRLQTAAPLVRDEEPSLYVYRLLMGPHEQTGVAACFSLDEYDEGVIKKHERTRRDKEDDRTRHLLAIGAQTGPVFLTYRANPDVSEIVDRTVAKTPLFDFTATDGVRHVIWTIESHQQGTLRQAFEPVPALYIADGHHRAASAARARHELRATRGPGNWDRFLGVAFPHDQVQILAYNRVVRDLGGASSPELLSRLRERFPVAPGPAVPAHRGNVSMYLEGQWYTIEMGAPPVALPLAERLDVNRLQESVLTPILGIGDVRTDRRIDFVGGARGTAALEQTAMEHYEITGRPAVAFSLFPVSVDDLLSISDEGGIMPPKSTWFEPKLRDGLLSHVF